MRLREAEAYQAYLAALHAAIRFNDETANDPKEPGPNKAYAAGKAEAYRQSCRWLDQHLGAAAAEALYPSSPTEGAAPAVDSPAAPPEDTTRA